MEQQITNQEKVAAIFDLIEKNQDASGFRYEHTTSGNDFVGQININGLNFSGVHLITNRKTENHQLSSDSTYVKLNTKDELLGKITLQHVVVNESILYGQTDGAMQITRDLTETSVVSPRWQEKDGVLTVLEESTQNDQTVNANQEKQVITKLQVFHAANEKGADVLDHIYQTVMEKQAQKKLSQLNLNTKAADLTKEN